MLASFQVVGVAETAFQFEKVKVAQFCITDVKTSF